LTSDHARAPAERHPGEDARAGELFQRLASRRVINAAGSVTRFGASPVAPEVAAAMAESAGWSVDIAELQGVASQVIVDATGAEAGIVTSGAAAGLLVGAAACIAGLDPARMGRLPDTAGLRDEFIVARSHRNSYDHAVRAAGARLIEVGLPDRLTGCGVRDTEAWEYAAAIGERTAGILYLARADARPELAAVVQVARARNVPVLVDAAAELPPARNLRRFIEAGADLVVFSGGKGIGGPAASGILCGRRILVASALLQQLDLDYVSGDWLPPANLLDRQELAGIPRHGIGRSCKVGKEQIVGLLTALVRFGQQSDAARNQRHHALVKSLAEALGALPALRVRAVVDAHHGDLPLLELSLTPRTKPAAPSAQQLAARLRAAAPAVHVDATSADAGILMLVPTCLRAEDVPLIVAAFAAALR
jgi:L-seryl-tRNA(Ser) seleniumtransferase